MAAFYLANLGCHRAVLNYNEQVRLNRYLPWLGMLAAFVLGCTGCGGINASHTVSPASFFLPGLLKADPPATNAPAISMVSKEVALAR